MQLQYLLTLFIRDRSFQNVNYVVPNPHTIYFYFIFCYWSTILLFFPFTTIVYPTMTSALENLGNVKRAYNNNDNKTLSELQFI